MKWDQQVSTVSSKASKVLGIVRRNLRTDPRFQIGKGNGAQDFSPTNRWIWKWCMGSLLREGYSKAGESSEKRSAIRTPMKA